LGRAVTGALMPVLALVCLSPWAKAEPPEPGLPVAVNVSAAGRTLEIPAYIQKQAGLEFARLDLTRIIPELGVQGQVVDIVPLVELRRQYLEATAEAAAAHSALSRAQSALVRLKSLRREPDDVPARQIADAETLRDETLARRQAAEARVSAAREAISHQWGDAVGGRALAAAGAQGELFPGQVLLLIAAAPGIALSPGVTIRVGTTSDRRAAVVAVALGPAPLAYATVAGSAWYAVAPAAGFRTGAHVHGWIAVAGEALPGVLVPGSAVVWQGGAPWAYVRIDASHFARFSLAGTFEIGGDRFVPDPAYAGREIVAAGAQTLLSEEQRAQIPDEDDNP
jgi:hypothetical protein